MHRSRPCQRRHWPSWQPLNSHPPPYRNPEGLPIPGRMSLKRQLGAILVERGLVSQDDVDAAMVEQARTSRSLGQVLVARELVTEADVISALAEQAGLEYVDLADVTIDPTASGAISDSLARRYQVLPVYWEGTTLVVATADPSNVLAVDDIRS